MGGAGNNYHSNMLMFTVAMLMLLGGVYVAPSPVSHARIINGIFSNLLSSSTKWVRSLKSTTRTTIASRPMMKFESGYAVETVFDGSKLGIEPYALEILPNGELLILDSVNSNLYRVSASLSLYSRAKLVAGSAEGYAGHVDGKHREGRMNHPKGVAVDDRGNIYVADNMNMAIRKISDSGITTIAGGKSGRSGHVDGASEDAKFSSDFDIVYVGSSCSLLVIDRGNKAIREIQLHFEDCAYQYGSGFPRGMTVLVAAGFVGYILALLQRKVGMLISPENEHDGPKAIDGNYQVSDKVFKSVRPPLIPAEDDQEKQQEGFLGSLGKLVSDAGTSVIEIVSGLTPGYGKKRHEDQYPNLLQQSATWPMQDSYVIRDDDEPPSIETKTPTPKKTYAFMSKDAERMRQWQQGKSFYGGWDDIRQQRKEDLHQHQQQVRSTKARTYYEQNHEMTKEISFGAAQENDGKNRTVVIKPISYEDSAFNYYDQSRGDSGYTNGY